MKMPWNLWEAVIHWLRLLPWVDNNFWEWAIKNIENTKHSIDVSVWNLWAHKYEDNFLTNLWDFASWMVGWSALLKWWEMLNKWWKLLNLWEKAIEKLPKWMLDKLAILKSKWVDDKILNLMASTQKDFAIKFPMLAKYVSRIASSVWTWLKDMSAFSIVHNWEVTKEDLLLWGWLSAAPWVIWYWFKKMMWTPVTSVINAWIEELLWYLWHLDWKVMLEIKDNPELFKKALNWEIDHNKFITAILNKVPNISNKEEQIKKINNMFQSIWKNSKIWYEKWINDIRTRIEEWLNSLKEQKKWIWEDFSSLKWWNIKVSNKEVQWLTSLVKNIYPKLPSLWEWKSIWIINKELNALSKEAEKWKATYADLVKIKQNVSELIPTASLQDRSWRLLIEAEQKINNYISSISDTYKNLSEKYAPIVTKHNNFVNKFIKKWENNLINDKTLLNIVNDKNKLKAVADVMWLKPQQLEKEINWLQSLKQSSKIWDKYVDNGVKAKNTIDKLNINSPEINKTKNIINDVKNKEDLIWWDLKALTLDKLSKLKTENDVREEFVKVLKWDDINKKLFIQWVQDNFWDKFTKELKTLKVLEWIWKHLNWWSSIASNALNAKILAKWTWVNLWDRQSLVLWQLIKNPLYMSRLFVNYVRWVKWDASLSKTILKKVEDWTHLNDKELQFVANAILNEEVHSKNNN